MKYLYAIIFQLFLLWLPAQSSEIFIVSKKIKMIPDVDTLMAGNDYKFQMAGIALKDVRAGRFELGTLTITDSNIDMYLNYTAYRLGKATLKFYDKTNNSGRIIFQKTYTIVKAKNNLVGVSRGGGGRYPIQIAEPYPDNNYTVTADSALVQVNRLLVALTPIPVNNTPVNTRLRMGIECGGSRSNFEYTRLELTSEMQQTIAHLKKGCSVIIQEVYYYPPNAPPFHKILGPFKITIN